MPARSSTLETRAAVSLLLDGAPHELVAAVCPPLTPANHKKFALDADTYLYHQTRAALDLARDVLGPAELRKHQALSAAEAGMLQIPASALRSWCATFIAVPHPDHVVVRGWRPRPDHVLAALAALKKRERKLVAAKPSPQLSIPLAPEPGLEPAPEPAPEPEPELEPASAPAPELEPELEPAPEPEPEPEPESKPKRAAAPRRQKGPQ